MTSIHVSGNKKKKDAISREYKSGIRVKRYDSSEIGIELQKTLNYVSGNKEMTMKKV